MIWIALGFLAALDIYSLILARKVQMTNAELLALLQAEAAEVHDIAGKVQTLLDTIAAGSGVPQDVQDAANALKTSLDALNTEAGP